MLLYALLACDMSPDDAAEPKDSAGCTAAIWHRDADGDGTGDADQQSVACDAPEGFVADASDCDDTDARVYPGATETCDGADEDCDGAVDEDAADTTTWYDDGDGDGYGDPALPTVACDAPPGHVADATDCDDTDRTASPEGAERCDGVDDDCDGVVDEGAYDATTWYADADGDGFGDSGVRVDACEPPDGYGADRSDCDDTRAWIFPGAPEQCDGVLDENCDSRIDEDEAVDALAWYPDADGDGYAGDGAPVWACDAPEGHHAATDDCDDADPHVSPAGIETCDGVDEDCDGSVDDASVDAPAWYADTDGDGFGDPGAAVADCAPPAGYVATDTDCDATDAAVFPGAPETCDGVDQDCDGTPDDGAVDAPTWYADGDGDGAGDAAHSVSACAAAAGYVAAGTDCDDGDATVFPGAEEVCDGIDEDCDGAVDAGAVDAPTWYADADGDGYGDSAAPTPSCAAPAGHLADGTDCDDTRAWVSPGAVETCGTSIDDDCDGDTLGVGAYGCRTWYRDDDADGYGTTDARCACAADGAYTASRADDCDDTAATAHPGGTELLGTGIDEDCDGDEELRVTDADVLIRYTRNDYLGIGEYPRGDVDLDGDGYDDLALGTPNYGGSPTGGVIVFRGPLTDPLHPTTADAFLYGDAGDEAGHSLAVGVDSDGDGLDELLVGARSGDVAWLLEWPGTGSTALSTAARATFDGTGLDGTFVCESGAIDLDGDGDDDLPFCGYYADTYSGDDGAIFLVEGPVAASSLIVDATGRLVGDGLTSTSRLRSAAVGDTDGDGVDELLVGSSTSSASGVMAGAAFLLRGVYSGTAYLADVADATFYGIDAGDAGGCALDAAGDVDGDGLDDVLIGAWGAAALAGEAYLVVAPFAGTVSLSTARATYAGQGDEMAGSSVAGLGDVDGDGTPDRVIGAVNAGGDAGAAYLFYGAVPGTHSTSDARGSVVGNAWEDNPTTLARVGDLLGDGDPDLYLGSERLVSIFELH